MADSKVHALVGAGTCVAGWFLYCHLTERKVNFLEVGLAAAAGAFVGLIPDLLEPAVHPNHRNFFHSVTTAALQAGWNQATWDNSRITQEHRVWVTLCSAAYLSHLVLDSGTPKGLPLLFN